MKLMTASKKPRQMMKKSNKFHDDDKYDDEKTIMRMTMPMMRGMRRIQRWRTGD